MEDSDKWLGVAPSQSSAASTAQRAYFFEDGNELLNICQETIICGGDFNSHIGKRRTRL